MNDEIPPSERPTPPDRPSSEPTVTPGELQAELDRRVNAVKGMVRTQRDALENHEGRIDVLERKVGAFEDGVTSMSSAIQNTSLDVGRLTDWITAQKLFADGLDAKLDRLLELVGDKETPTAEEPIP